MVQFNKESKMLQGLTGNHKESNMIQVDSVEIKKVQRGLTGVIGTEKVLQSRNRNINGSQRLAWVQVSSLRLELIEAHWVSLV